MRAEDPSEEGESLMVDHNVDEVVMVRRLSNGEPDHPGGLKRIVDDETAAAVDKVQLDAIEANARNRVQVVPGQVEAPEVPVGPEPVVERVGVVTRDVNAGVRAEPVPAPAEPDGDED